MREVSVTTLSLIGQPWSALIEVADLEHRHIVDRTQRLADEIQTQHELLRNLAHEVKNPLGGLRGAAQLLEAELPDQRLTEYTQVIISEADRLQSLVDRLAAPHSSPMQWASVNVHEVCERVCALVRAEFADIELSRDYDASMPEIKADPARLVQALLNVVRNAAQILSQAHTPDPLVTVRTRIARQVMLHRRQHRMVVEIAVIDNGPGVPETLKDKIFHPLVTGRDGGTGLGLSLAQDLLQQHGGLIEMDSRPGHTEFRLFDTTGVAMKPVWIVDDDQAIRWVLEKALSRAGFETVSFSNAGDVEDALDDDVPAALVTDIRMPGKDGLKLLNDVKQHHPGLPVIVMTAYGDLDSTVSAFQGGAFDFLPKPFDVNEAVTLIERAVQEAPKQDSASSDKEPANKSTNRGMLTQSASPAMQEVFRAIGRLAQSNVTVLITGESGSGKELVARALHQHGARANAPFVALNTAAIPRDLLEAELFGHERGAFTGASAARRGRFRRSFRWHAVSR